MSDAVITWPDVEDAVRQYLRNWPALNDIIDRRVFFGVPKKDARFPMLTIMRVGGGDDTSEAPVDNALIQVQVWGRVPTEGGGKAECTHMALLVRQALSELRSRTSVTTDVDLCGATVANVVWVPDPADDRPRYIVTATVTAISSTQV